jgi:endonuclease/exonuclease/phosphatase family metal-dependent hydrolase
MKISTINIDWLQNKSALKQFFIDDILRQNSDFVIITETLDSFNLPDIYFKSKTNPMPQYGKFQYLDYGAYNKGETSIRCTIFSKYKPIETFNVADPNTCICCKYLVNDKEVVVYASIIGTWGIKHQNEIAKKELYNFKFNLEHILAENENVIIAGDLNTSFILKEKRQLSGINSRQQILEFTNSHQVYRATETLNHCIDHIFITQNLSRDTLVSTFLDKNELKDEPHKGVSLEFSF